MNNILKERTHRQLLCQQSAFLVSKLKEKVNRYENSKQTYDLRNDVEKLIIEFENCKNFDNAILKKLIEKIEINKNNKIDIIFKI